jgi:lipooligosaccharide transport system ATP-binding protein
VSSITTPSTQPVAAERPPAHPDEQIVVARDLIKHYGDVVAVNGISFEVRRGECFGLLGPNGAGKTTTIRMITCVSPVTSGELMVDWMPVQSRQRRIKATLGVVPQDDNLDPDLTVYQNLRAYARYFDIPREVAEERITEILTLFQLNDRRKDKIDQLSGGLKRRLTIARGLLNSPKILVLDEPTTGLDPQARHLVWQKLRYLRSQGVTMLLTTHYMDEAAHLCDRILIIDEGRIIAEGTPDQLVREHAGNDVMEIHLGDADPEPVMRELMSHDDLNVERYADILYVYTHGQNGVDVRGIEENAERVVYRRANLEDVFLKLTGRGLAGEA